MRRKNRGSDSPPEEVMRVILEGIAERCPKGGLRIEPHYRWETWRGFTWESDFAVFFYDNEFPSFLVEVDGYAYHGGQKEFVRDRQKDRDAHFFQMRVIRFAAVELRDRKSVESELWGDYIVPEGLSESTRHGR